MFGMEKYDWSTDKIERLINNLAGNIDEVSIRDFNTLNAMIGNNRTDVEIQFTEQELLQIETLKPLVQKWAIDFCCLSKDNCIELPHFDILNLSNTCILNLINEFYKTRSSNIYSRFLLEFKRKNTNLRLKDEILSNSAIAYHIYNSKESFISVKTAGTIMDSAKLSHEYGHSVSFLLNPDFILNNASVFFREADGLYFQMRFLEYLINNGIYPEEAILALLSLNNHILRKARFLSYSFSVFDAVYFCSYLASIELCSYDNAKSDNVLELLIKENPTSIQENLDIIEKYITIGENVGTYQKKLIKQMSSYFIQG